MNWYYESAGQQQGPVPDTELDRLLAEGKITPDTLVWREGLAGWAPMRTARPAPAGLAGQPPPPAAAAVPGADAPPPGYIRCSLTGKYFPPSEIIYIEGRPYSAEAKPKVMESLQAGAALPTSDTMRTGPAWEQRDQLGFFKAGWETCKSVIAQPQATFSTMRREGGIGGPLTFFLITNTIGTFFAVMLILLVVFGAAFAMVSSVGTRNNMPAGMLPGMGFGMIMMVVVYAVLIPISLAIQSFVASGLVQLALHFICPQNRGFETTYRVFCYAAGGLGILLLIPIPYCSLFVAGIWSLVVQCIGLARAHEIPTGRAVAAVLLPTCVCCVAAFGFQLIAGVLQAAARN